jgi:Na+/H+ antiporter NhaC
MSKPDQLLPLTLGEAIVPVAGVDLYEHVRETVLTSLIVLVLALACSGCWAALACACERYQSNTGYAAIDRLASRGGMASMLATIWLVIAALAFGSVVEKIGVLERLSRR